ANAFGFGGPSRPLNRCLVNVVNARETSRMLEIDLGRGDRIQECRGLVKAVLRGLELKECVKDASLYLPEGRKRQAALDAGRDGIEYLASAVEFDAWDKLDKEFTSNVALRNMTPDNVQFVRMALDAAGTCLDSFLGVFPPVAVEDAGEVYR
ncbi:unnamed protein product, partial [Choristocarpus tenellus]